MSHSRSTFEKKEEAVAEIIRSGHITQREKVSEFKCELYW